MIEISRAQLEMLADWFTPEMPGPVIASHVLRTGQGHAWTDRWPDVQAVVVETNYVYVMVGDPAALDPRALDRHVAGLVAAPPQFLPLLEETFSSLHKWPRVVGLLTGDPIEPPHPAASRIEFRRFSAADGDDLHMLSAESIWVAQTWGGGRELARSGYGWGAWVDGTLASVACTFFLGHAYEDIGVITEPGYRRMGLNTRCAYELCLDIIARRRRPTWTTSTDNLASRRVAQKLGFTHQRDDWLYVVNAPVPSSD